MILVPNARMAAEFMQARMNLDSTEYCQGFIATADRNRDSRMTFDSVGVCVLWDNFVGRTCTISIAIQDKEIFTRKIIKECFRYPFEEAGREVVLALVDSHNEKSIKLCEGVGFERVSVLPNGGMDGDLIVFAMTKAACRWIRQEH